MMHQHHDKAHLVTKVVCGLNSGVAFFMYFSKIFMIKVHSMFPENTVNIYILIYLEVGVQIMVRVNLFCPIRCHSLLIRLHPNCIIYTKHTATSLQSVLPVFKIKVLDIKSYYFSIFLNIWSKDLKVTELKMLIFR